MEARVVTAAPVPTMPPLVARACAGRRKPALSGTVEIGVDVEAETS
jgi:hypothetical protein